MDALVYPRVSDRYFLMCFFAFAFILKLYVGARPSLLLLGVLSGETF
jgi:hypothetical protein